MSNNEDARISEAAYHLWVKEGRPEGKDLDLWLKAQEELKAAEAPAPKKRAPAKPRAATAAKDKPKAAKPKPKTPAKPKAKSAKA